MGNGTRFYDPDLGQFLEKDPVYGDESEPRSLSPYAYSFNNPVWYMDPTGLAAQDPGDKFSSTLPDAQNPKTTIGWTALGNDGSYGVSIGPLDPEKKPSHKKKHHPSATRKKAAQLPIITAPQPPPSTFPSNANLPPHGVTLEPTPETTAPEPPRPVEATVTQPGTTWSQTVDEFVGVASGLYGTLDDYGIISKAQIQGGIKGLENAGRGALSTGAGYLTHPITTFQNIQAQNADATIDIFKGLWNFREVAGAVYEGGQTLGLEGWQELEGEIGGNLAFGEASEALLWGAVSPGSGTPQTIFNGRVPSTGTRFAPPGGPAGESSISFAKKPLTPDTALGTFDADFANLSVPQKIDAAFQEIESAFGAGYAEKIRELYGSAGRSFFKSTETLGTHGLTNQGKSVIGVNTNLGNAKILANTLLHEVRHLRQYRKILSRGGTRRTWNNLSETAKERYATAPNVWQGRRLGLSPEDLTIFEEYQQHWRK